MEYLSTPLFSIKPSRIALGTWAIGGSLWGGTTEKESVLTIQKALEKGVNVLDTAPAYGQGEAERFVGKALKSTLKSTSRDKILISTKVGIEFKKDGSAARNLTEKFMIKDFEASLKRLQSDYIDIYFIHWPDPLEPIDVCARFMLKLYEEGKIRSIGLSNFSVEQCRIFQKIAPCHFSQPPYNLFERNIEKDLLAYCKKENILLMTYSALCRGFLSGKMSKERAFSGDDLRKGLDKKFQSPAFEEYLAAAEKLKQLAREKYGKTLLEFAVRWVLDQGSDIAIWGARRPDQLLPIDGIFGWHIDQETKKIVDKILTEIKHPQDITTYMGPPLRAA